MIPSFLRGKLAGWKKKNGKRGVGGGGGGRTPCDRLVGCAPEFRLQAEGYGEGLLGRVGGLYVCAGRSGGVCMFASLRENVEELVIK